MTGYEWQCRRLLLAFPPEFRRDRGEDLIATLLDDAGSGASRVPLATAFDLVVSGTQMRAVRAGAARSAKCGITAAMAMGALIGLGLQAALAVASVVYKAEHGVVFYLPAGGPYTVGHDPLGAQLLVAWVALAVLSTAALTAAIRGAWRAAAALSVTVSSYLTVVTVAVATDAFSSRPLGSLAFNATPGFLAVAAVSASLATVTAVKSRTRPPVIRTSWWLAAAAALALLFALVGDGNAAQGPPDHLTANYANQGGVMTALQILVVSAVVIGLAWSHLDPRVGWAIAMVTVPFVIYQIGFLALGGSYWPGWESTLPLILATTGIAALASFATLTSKRLRRS